MSDMYREQLLDHARRPRQYGILDTPTVTRHEANPSCGDVIDIYLAIDAGGRIERISFTGQGCVISQAATSILFESVLGKPVAAVLAMNPADVVGLVGIEPGPMRMNCVLLPLRALQKCLFK